MRVEAQLKAVDGLVKKMKMKQRTKNSTEKEEVEPILMFGFFYREELGLYGWICEPGKMENERFPISDEYGGKTEKN